MPVAYTYPDESGNPISATLPDTFTNGQQVWGRSGVLYTVNVDANGSYSLINPGNGGGPVTILGGASASDLQNYITGGTSGQAPNGTQAVFGQGDPNFGGQPLNEAQLAYYSTGGPGAGQAGFGGGPTEGDGGSFGIFTPEQLGQGTPGWIKAFGEAGFAIAGALLGGEFLGPSGLGLSAAEAGGIAGAATNAEAANVGGGNVLTGALEGGVGGFLAGGGLSALTEGTSIPSLSDIMGWLSNETGISLGDIGSNIATKAAIGAGKGAITSQGDPTSSLLGGVSGAVGSGLSTAGNYIYNNLPNLGSIFGMSDLTDTSGDSGGSTPDLSNGPNTNSVLYTGGGGNSFAPSDPSSGMYYSPGFTTDANGNIVQDNSGGDGSSGGSSGGSGVGGAVAGAASGAGGSILNSFLNPALLGAGANALGSYFASANQAAAAQNSTAAQLAMFGQTQSNLLPFIQAGQGAAGALAAGTGLNTSNPFASPLLAPPTANLNEAALSQTPGYQFNLSQGLESTQNAFAAQGLGSSGAAMKGAAQYATGLADSTYQNQFNNAVTNQTNQFNRLMALSNQGQSSAANQGTLGTQVAANIGSNIVGAANAGSAAITSGASGASNALTLNSYLNLLAGQQNSPSGTA